MKNKPNHEEELKQRLQRFKRFAEPIPIFFIFSIFVAPVLLCVFVTLCLRGSTCPKMSAFARFCPLLPGHFRANMKNKAKRATSAESPTNFVRGVKSRFFREREVQK